MYHQLDDKNLQLMPKARLFSELDRAYAKQDWVVDNFSSNYASYIAELRRKPLEKELDRRGLTREYHNR